MSDNQQSINDQLSLFAGIEIGAEKAEEKIVQKFGKYIAYVDESGDHSMSNIDKQYPVFVLALCIFNKDYYSRSIVNSIERLKFENFGHDIIILHEREIRKQIGIFNFKTKELVDKFQRQLSQLVEASNFILISTAIDKTKISDSDEDIENPYHIALRLCLEQFYNFLLEKNEQDLTTHVVVECRGPKEDKELELEFRRICSGSNKLGIPLPFEIIFADKKANSSGLQLADLVARPIGLSVIKPDQKNRAFEILKRKFFCSGGRSQVGKGYEGFGYTIYPQATKKRRKKAKSPGETTEAIAPTGKTPNPLDESYNS